jgi:hypothetical protein
MRELNMERSHLISRPGRVRAIDQGVRFEVAPQAQALAGTAKRRSPLTLSSRSS